MNESEFEMWNKDYRKTHWGFAADGRQTWIAALEWILYELMGEQTHIRSVIHQEIKELEEIKMTTENKPYKNPNETYEHPCYDTRTYEVKVHCINCLFNGVVWVIKGCNVSGEPCPYCGCCSLKVNTTVTW